MPFIRAIEKYVLIFWAFRKILGSVGQKWISEKVSKGGPFGSAGGRRRASNMVKFSSIFLPDILKQKKLFQWYCVNLASINRVK